MIEFMNRDQSECIVNGVQLEAVVNLKGTCVNRNGATCAAYHSGDMEPGVCYVLPCSKGGRPDRRNVIWVKVHGAY